MSVLKTGCFSNQPPVEGVEAESLGLNLLQARAIYDAWRDSPRKGPRAIVHASGVPVEKEGAAELYLRGNRAKWFAFNKPVSYRSPGCLCTLHESCKVCRAAERKRKPYVYSAAELVKASPIKRPFTTVLFRRKMGKTHAARQAAERRPLESTQQAKLIGLCKVQGWWAYKTEAPGMAGIPDLQILKPASSVLRQGKIAFVEIKRPGEKPTKLQLHIIEELNNMGFFAFWADDPVKAFEYLRQVWDRVPR